MQIIAEQKMIGLKILLVVKIDLKLQSVQLLMKILLVKTGIVEIGENVLLIILSKM
jgi:hypothetical protein